MQCGKNDFDILKGRLNMVTYPCYLINTGIKYFLHFLRLFCTHNIIPSLSMKHSTNIFARRIYNMLPLRFNLLKIKENLRILIRSKIFIARFQIRISRTLPVFVVNRFETLDIKMNKIRSSTIQ